MSRQCPHCESYNARDALHCDQCGAAIDGALGPSPPTPSSGPFWLIVAVLVVIGLWMLQQRWGEPLPLDTAGEGGGSPDSSRLTSTGSVEDPPRLPDDFLLNDPGEDSRADGSPPVTWGWVTVTDPFGLSLGKMAGAATAGGWLALPRVQLLGASQVRFREGMAGEATLVEGAFRPRDPLSLWRLEPIPDGSSMPLARWNSRQALYLVDPTGRQVEWEPRGAMKRIGDFLRAQIDQDEPRVLTQDGAIVGWVPGHPFGGAWLWAGPVEDRLSGASLTHFQDAEFEGGKIAYARRILDTDLDDLAALLSLDESMARPARLAAEEIPDVYSRPQLIRAARDRLMRGVNSTVPGSYFDAVGLDVLLWLESPELCAIWLSLALRDGAIDRLARAVDAGDVLRRMVGADPAFDTALDLLPDLFVTGAESCRSLGLTADAIDWIVAGRNRYPEDDALRLLDAERLLNAGDLDSCAQQLAREVARSDLKLLRQGLLNRLKMERRAEGRVLIEFTPGSSVIEVTALVGGVPIDFVIDTGASSTSIPTSVLGPLGITVDENTPRQQVRTASDEFEAPVVALPRVNLQGAVVDGMRATVLDLPGQPGTGLLGLDFLGRFRIDLDIEKGWLLLEPR